MEQLTFNLYPIFKCFIIILAIVGGYSLINNIAHLISRGFKDKLDNNVMNALISKYPDVKENFIIKPEKEQNIENNQEIHEINKKIEALEEKLKGWEDAH